MQEGIYIMLDLFIDLVTTRLDTDPVPVGLLNILSTAFDLKNDWNHKNKDQSSKSSGWQSPSSDSPSSSSSSYVISTSNGDFFNSYGWLCDLINLFGERRGFELIKTIFDKEPASAEDSLTARSMAALLNPVAQCAELICPKVATTYLSSCMDKAFKYVEGITDLRSKEIAAVSDLLAALKLLCQQFWKEHVEACDTLRLNMICRMLKTPVFNSRMNALKEVSRLIEESKEEPSSSSGRKTAAANNQNLYISVNRLVEWMAENKVLTVALEGNIDQVQYTDRIRSIVEFLGPRLSTDELTKMWNLQETSPNVMDNVYSIMSGAANKFSLAQFEHLTSLIKEKWEISNDRIREKLLALIGQIGKEAKQIKSTQTILQLLWEVSHLEALPQIFDRKGPQRTFKYFGGINLQQGRNASPIRL